MITIDFKFENWFEQEQLKQELKKFLDAKGCVTDITVVRDLISPLPGQMSFSEEK